MKQLIAEAYRLIEACKQTAQELAAAYGWHTGEEDMPERDWRTAYNELMREHEETKQSLARCERILTLICLMTPPEMLDTVDERSGLTIKQALEAMEDMLQP